jgi:hypothetical protein
MSSRETTGPLMETCAGVGAVDRPAHFSNGSTRLEKCQSSSRLDSCMLVVCQMIPVLRHEKTHRRRRPRIVSKHFCGRG